MSTSTTARPRAARDPAATRERILQAAERLVLAQGFAATTVDAVAAEAGVAKGAFFHHFASKAALARAIVSRYADLDAEHLDAALAQATRLARDPLQQLLVLVGLFAESAAAISGDAPGCLFASFLYERQLLDEETRAIVAGSVLRWRERLVPLLEAVVARHPPRLPVRLDELADLVTSAFEGGFVLARALSDPRVVAQQVAHVRNYLELLFAPAGPDAAVTPSAARP